MYSTNEWRLIKALGFQELGEIIDSPTALYRIMVEYVFRKNLKGNHVEALRRAYNALNVCKPYRMTPEFDELVYFEWSGPI